MTSEETLRRTFAKPTSHELAKSSQSDLVLFVAASVGRISNLYPHWLLLRVENQVGIPSSRLMVLWLLDSWNELTMGEIARAIDLTPRGVTRIIDGLEAEDLARRAPRENDKRVKVVHLTNKGKKFLARSLPAVSTEFERLFSVLEKNEAVELIRLLENVTERMKHQIDAK